MRVALLLGSLLALSGLSACSGDSAEEAAEKERLAREEAAAKEVTINLSSPADGAEFEAEEPVSLKVTAKKGAKATEIDSATWTIGRWSGEGTETEANGLPSGEHTVEVAAVIDGETYTASVAITVLEPAITNFTYAGTLEADVIVHTNDYGDFDDHCTTAIGFTLDSGTIAGSGTCAVFDDFDFDPIAFVMDGTVRGGDIDGALVMTFDGTEARTPYAGPGTAGDSLTATFDSTHRSSDGSVRIVGSWTAAPQ